MNRALCVWIDQALVGTVYENTGIWSFQYEAAWLAQGFELAPGLPLSAARIEDSGSVRPVQWFFDNLLPEENARQLLAGFMAQCGAGSSAGIDAWAMLAFFGAESAGALTLLPPGVALPEGGLRALSDAELDARIRAMPRQALAAQAPKKMSLAGAQQKLAIVMQEGQLFEPIGARASTHILKPDVLSEHYPCSAVNEWFCARLAHMMALAVPRVALRFVPSPVYIIERFDRKISAERVERLHTLDAMQLLTLAARTKYGASGLKALQDILKKCRTPAVARVALFRWTLFNILIGNSDAHLKNISLFAGRAGYELAPHYDLLSIGAWANPESLGPGESPWSQVEMAWPIGAVSRYDQLRKTDLQEFARQLRVLPTGFNREFNKMINGIEAAAQKLLEEFESRTDVPAVFRASQLRMLRSIRYLPVASMVKQLRE